MPKSQIRRGAPLVRALLAALSATLLAACTTVPAPPSSACPSCAVCAPAPAAACPKVPAAAEPPPVPALQAARWADLPGWDEDDLSAAWPAFLLSCQALAGKPKWPLWRAACSEAKGLPARDSGAQRRFFEARLAPYRLSNADGTTSGLVTGYYEPLLHGARQRSARYAQALLGVPPDLLNIELADVLPELKGMRLRGRLQGNKVVPYYSRADIGARQANYADRVLLWVDDAVELFFLQIQGSGRVQLPDGKLVRVGYADQNGHPYQSIGRVLIERGELSAEQASMQGIQAWARANPEKLDELLNSNPSYVFFREVAGSGNEGPQGALGVALTAGRSIAVDPRQVPLGAPVFLATTQPNSAAPLRRLMLAQDTGGAIRGVVRADFFWGFGADAGNQAGKMKQQGEMWVLLPPGAAP